MTTHEDARHFTRLPLALVEPSLTNPRKHFDAAKLQELAESIKASDMHQPILVRPLPGHRMADTAWERNSLQMRTVKPTHEIVAGERRYRAAKLAGLETVPVLVCNMTDEQVLEAQVIENLQRTDLSELEEAEGFQSLMDLTHTNADQLGAKVGKSRSYVYGRLKLLDLGPEGREALRLGHVDASVALLVARIPDTQVQAKAVSAITEYRDEGHHMSTRNAADLIRRLFMLRLDAAPFDIKAQALTDAGACTACLKRTGANPDLFSDMKGSDLCTDPTCHAAKVSAHQAATMAKAHERGLTIIEGREAKALMPNAWIGRIDGYLRLDDKTDSPTDQPLRKVLAKAMAQAGVKEMLLANPHREGELVAVLPTHQVSELLALAAQLDAKAAPAAQAMAEQTERDRRAERAALASERKTEFETAWRWAVLQEVWAEAKRAATSMQEPDGFGLPEQLARHVATRMGKGFNQDRAKRLNKLLGLDKVAPVETLLAHIAAYHQPGALLWLLVAEADVEYRHWLPDEYEANRGLLLAAEAFKINIDAVQKSVKSELREKHAAEDQKALLPLDPAAQASGVRGGKALKTTAPAALARGKPKTTAHEAITGIAAAMQSLEEVGGGDCAPLETKPDGCAVGEDGRATSPDASATLPPTDGVAGVATETSGALAGVAEEGQQVERQGTEPATDDYLSAKTLVQEVGRVSVRLLKESMGIGTTKALALIDQLEAAGVVSACGERGARTVLVAQGSAA